MGWKGNLRSFNASMKRYEREAQRERNANLRLMQKQEREFEKMQLAAERQQAFDDAKYEVQKFEYYVNELVSLHTSCRKKIDWNALSISSAPKPPTISYKNKDSATNDYEKFEPTFFQKLFRQTDKIKKELEQKIEQAREKDVQEYQLALEKFNAKLSRWENDVELSNKVLNYEEESFVYVLENKSNISNFSSDFSLQLNEDKSLSISVYINGQDVIPTEVKSFLKSGKVSIKPMPKTKYHELYQDHVCSIVLKVARDVFALLPIEKATITVFDHILDQSTGYLEDMPILSALIIEETINKLNLDKIDPSEALKNFNHNMSFKKTSGFLPIDIMECDVNIISN